MSRSPTFDRTAVLDRAMAAFWAKGFEATSIADLVAATGLERGSLYAAFASKQGLFEAVLAHYGATVSAHTFAPLEAPDADLATVETVFRALARANPSAPAPGCLVTNTAIERAPHDAAVRLAIDAAVDRLEARLVHVLERAAQRGQLRPEVTPAAAAALLVAVAQGLRVLARLDRSPVARGMAVATAFTALRPRDLIERTQP